MENKKFEELQQHALMIFAQKTPLSVKVEKSIAMLKEFHRLLGETFYLAFSGGKDSVVIKRLCEMAEVPLESFYNQTTIDPPELIYFIRKFHPEVKWNIPKEGNLIFYPTKVPKGPPTRINRWCCQIYKERGGTGRTKIIGVRAEESPNRAKNWKEYLPNLNGGKIICPILYWTNADIWEFIRQENIPYCSLYDEVDEVGKKLFTRLGCVGCPMSGRKGRLRDFKRWPGFERLWKIGIKAYFDRWKNVPRRDGNERWLKRFSKWEELWDWWIEDPDAEETGQECQSSLLFS